MAIAVKVTKDNHLPAVGDDRFPVYSKQFNALVDVVNDLEPIPATAPQSISGAGAITVNQYKTEITTTGADAFTMVDGTSIGQKKKIKLIVDGGDATLTPSNLSGGTTITFSAVGDEVLLVWDGTEWVLVDDSSLLGTGATPVLA